MLNQPLAMANSYHTLRTLPTCFCYPQHGSNVLLYTQKPFVRLWDPTSLRSLVVASQTQVGTICATLASPDSVGVDSESLPSPISSTLSKRLARLADLICQLASGADVPSSLEPYLYKLSLKDWNTLLIEVASKDWKISRQILSYFMKVASGMDGTAFDEIENGNQNIDNGSNALDSVLSSGQAIENEDNSESDDEKKHSASPALKLHTTFARLLARQKRLSELEQLKIQMEKSGINLDATFYNAYLDAYAVVGMADKCSEILQEMEDIGIEPNEFVYAKAAVAMMNKRNTDLELPKQMIKNLMEKSVPVNISVFRNLLRVQWESRNIPGAEEALELLKASGNPPELKDFLKVMQLHGRRGNYERILELTEQLNEWNIQINGTVYDYLIHAYCKSGLMDKAKEVFEKYQTVLGVRPSPLALNMLIDGYGKQGLHQEALQTFDEIRRNGYRRTEVSYSSIISALAQVGMFDKAYQLYRRMTKEGVQPNLHTYSTLIRCHTKRDWTREGHKIYNELRKAPLEMTEASYGIALAHYIEGTWYRHAAALLKEIEDKGVPLDAVAHGAIVQSFSIVGEYPTPFTKAVQESEFEVCKLMTSLFLTRSQKEKVGPEHVEAVFSFLEKWKNIDSLEDKGFVYNAFLECFWKKNLKGLANRILGLAREAYIGHSRPRLIGNEWVIDVSGFTVGGAKVALLDLFSSKQEPFIEDNLTMVIITGDEFNYRVTQDPKVLKGAISIYLQELDSPFVESSNDSRKLEANAVDVLRWVSQDRIKDEIRLEDSP